MSLLLLFKRKLKLALKSDAIHIIALPARVLVVDQQRVLSVSATRNLVVTQ